MRILLAVATLLLLSPPTWALSPEAEQIKAKSMVLLGNGRYAELNAFAENCRTGGKTADGIAKITLFYAGLDALPKGDDREIRLMQWRGILATGQDWNAKAPSPAAVIGLAKMHLHYAWDLRGAGPTPDAAKAFADHVATARKILEAGISTDPEWVTTMTQVQNAERPAPVRGPGASPPLTIVSPPSDPNDELDAQSLARAKTRFLFQAGRYAELNAMAERLRASGEKTPAGTDKLELFYGGILEEAGYQTPSLQDKPNERQWAVVFGKARDWMGRAPSPAATITSAKLYEDYAWKWRGEYFSNRVKPGHWKMFFDNLAVAQDILERNKAQANIDPEWYDTMIDISRDAQWPTTKKSALAAEAIQANKYYLPIYISVATGLLPKWSGSWKAVDDVAALAVANTRDREGTGFYTRIYQMMNCWCDEMHGTLMDWNKMKVSFRDVQARYPVQWNINRFAYYACRLKDRKTATVLIPQITVHHGDAWGGNIAGYDQCKAWIQSR